MGGRINTSVFYLLVNSVVAVSAFLGIVKPLPILVIR